MLALYGNKGCIQKFPDWLPGARTSNDTALYHWMQLYRYFMSQSSEFCSYNLCVASKRMFIVVVVVMSLLTQSGNFGYTLVSLVDILCR
jgi:hypothetical protein